MTSPPARSDKRDRIIEAAIAVFAEKGFHAARISDIADRASVADGTIYLYFRNKEDVLLSIFEEKMDSLLGELGNTLRPLTDPREKIRAFAKQHVEQIRRDPDLAQVFQVELRQSRKFLRDYRPEKLWAYLDVFGRLVEEGKGAGLFRPDVDPFVAKWSFFGSLDELSIQWVLSRKRDRFNLEKAAEQVAEVVLRGIATDPQAPRTRSPS